MARQGIGTGSSPNDGAGDTLRAGAGKINANFSEIYNYFGDGTTLDYKSGIWNTVSVGINTLSNVGVGTTNPTSTLSVGGNANITGVVTASSFVGSGANITGISTSNITDFSRSSGSTIGLRTDVSATTGSVGAAATTNLSITGFKTYGLLKVGITSAAWVRLYVDAASRTSDADRSYLVDPAAGSGLIAEVRTETAGISTFLMTPGVIGWNNDSTTGSTVYAAVTNNEASAATITVTLSVVKMEN